MTRKEVLADGVELWLGDCREVLPTIEHVGLILTDPPYGIGIAANPVRQRHEKKDWDFEPIGATEIQMLLKAAPAHIIWGGNYFPLPTSQRFFVWDKMQPEGLTLAMCEMAWSSISGPAKMYQRRVVGYEKWHPTQKPVELMEWCLTFCTTGLVCDPYMGSGTTGVACVKRGRDFTGIEIDAEYFDLSCRRIEAALKQPDMFITPPQPLIQQELL